MKKFKKLLAGIMTLCMLVTLMPATVWAEAKDIKVTGMTCYDNGALETLNVQFGWRQGDAKGRMVVTDRPLDDEAFTDNGWVYDLDLNTFDEVLGYGTKDATDEKEKSFKILSAGSDDISFSAGETYNLSLTLKSTDVVANGMYYAYLWTFYSDCYYPDNLLCAIRVENGKVEYAEPTGGNRNDYVSFTSVAKIGDKGYSSLQEAVNNVQNDETIQLLAGICKEGTIKLPATLKNVTFKGAEGAVLKDMTIMSADGNSISYEGLTFDGITFKNSNILMTGQRSGDVIYEDLTITNCKFEDVVRTGNIAAVHFNTAADEAVKNFTFTNNVIDGVSGSSNSGFFGNCFTGEITVKNNAINNVAFYPYNIQIVTNDAIDDTFTVTGNTFSGSANGRIQALGKSVSGTDANTDTVTLTVQENIFKDITENYQICYYNFDKVTTTADISRNYYDIDIMENPDRIYYNSPAGDVEDLIEMGVFPIYTELKEDGTIDESSLFKPVAKIDDEYYGSVKDAVAVVENGDKIVLLNNSDEIIKVSREVEFEIDENGKTFSGSVVSEDGYTLTEVNGKYTVVENTPVSTPPSGGSSKPNYSASVDKNSTDNGSVKLSSTRAKAGSKVTITVTPDEGYKLDELKVLDKNGNEIDVKDNGDGTFTFTMPKGGVEVVPEFVAEIADTPATEEKDETTLVLTIGQSIYQEDGTYKANDVAPIIKGERTMLPIRLVSEALGATVTWNEADQAVTIVEGDTTIVIYIGQAFAMVNGNPVQLDAPAFIANDRTYLPVRFVAENLGANVSWDGTTQTVTIIG